MKKHIAMLLTVAALLSLGIFALECEYAIKPSFEYASPFKSGKAATVMSDGKSFIIDKFGNITFENQKSCLVRSNGLVMVVGENDLAAFYSSDGYRLTDFVYDTFPVTDAKTGEKTYKFGYYDGDGKSDLVPFSRNKKYGFINSKGVEVIPPKYDYAYGFTNGGALICSQGILSEYGTYTNGKYGLVSEDGREILPPDSYWVGTAAGFGFEYYLFYNGSADRTLVDIKGNVIKTDKSGFAPIDAEFILCNAPDGKMGVARKDGSFVVPIDNHESIEKVNKFFIVDNKRIINSEGKSIYDAKNNEKITPHYINIHKLSNLFTVYVTDGTSFGTRKYGLVDAYGKLVFEPVYDGISDLGEGLIYARRDGKNYLYSYYGEQLCILDGNNAGECVNGLFPMFDFTAQKYGYMLNPLYHPKVYVNSEKVVTDVYPKIENDRTLVPLRGVFEALGATVSWDDSVKTVTAVKDEITVKLQIGSTTLYKNGKEIAIDVPAKIENSRTLVPLRAVSEALECVVEWDGKERKVNIFPSNK